MTRERGSASPERVDEGSNEEKDCKLCGLPVSSRSRSRDGEFCCEGCRRVHETLGDEVDLRTQGVDEDGFEGVRSETGTVEEPEKEAERDGSLEVSYLDVEGMHCVACEVFLEERVTELGGVETADVSYVTGMMKVVHDPDTTTRDDLVDAVSTTGYDAGVGDTSNRTSEGETRGVASNEVDASRLVVGVVFGMFSMMWYVTVLYPEYLGLWSLVDMSGQVGTYLLLNVWVGSTVVVFYAGYPILRSAYVSIRSGLPNMDLLIALAALSAYAYSTAALVAGSTELYYDVSVAVVLAVSIGRYYERRIRDRATRKLSEIADERVEDARVRDGDGTEEVRVEEVDAEDEVVVRRGEHVPLDGRLIEGGASFDESLVTGESLPVAKEPGDEVVGGSVVVENNAVVEVGEEATSTLRRLRGVLWDIGSTRSGAQRTADRLAGVFVPLVLVIAVGTAGWKLVTADPTRALLSGLAVLVVSCPCALGTATPLAVASGVREALERKIVVTDGSAFEIGGGDDSVVVFDKTGTVSKPTMEVTEIRTDESTSEDEVLERAVSVEEVSQHPVAEALREELEERKEGGTEVRKREVSEPRVRPGEGVRASVGGEKTAVGSRSLMVGSEFDMGTFDGDEGGDNVVYVGWDGKVRGSVRVEEELRPGWRRVLGGLRDDGFDVVLLTGDGSDAAERFEDHVDEVFSGVPPEGKARAVERLGERYGEVIMVGDGNNDAPALAEADIGVAVGGRTALATEAAHVTVLSEDDVLDRVTETFGLLSSVKRRVRQNLGWAFVYNGIAVPLALVGYINPLFAAAAMSASSILVVANSSRSFDTNRFGGT